MRKVLLTVIAAVMCCMMFAGCSSKSLEDILTQSDISKQMDEQMSDLKKSYKSTYSKVEWFVKSNDLTYKYYYADDYEDEQINIIKGELESSSLKSQIAGMKDDIEKDIGIRPDSITFVYLTKDGTKIAMISE